MSPLARFAEANWSLVPPRLHHPLETWLIDGVLPDSNFLYAVLRHDLARARKEANATELTAIPDLLDFLRHDCPAQAFGSPSQVFEWAAMGGWRGMRDASEGMEKKIYEQPAWRGRLWPPGNGDEDE